MVADTHGDTLAVDLAAGDSVKAESDALVTMSDGLTVREREREVYEKGLCACASVCACVCL